MGTESKPCRYLRWCYSTETTSLLTRMLKLKPGSNTGSDPTPPKSLSQCPWFGSTSYILQLIVWFIFIQIFFVHGLCKTFFFLQEWCFVRSRSSKVIDFGRDRMRTFYFPLVRHSDLGPVLHRFRDIASLLCSWTYPSIFQPIFGGVPFGLDRQCWGQSEHVPYAIWPWNYVWSTPTDVITVPERHRQTDIVRQRDRRLIVASPPMRSITRQKNLCTIWKKSVFRKRVEQFVHCFMLAMLLHVPCVL